MMAPDETPTPFHAGELEVQSRTGAAGPALAKRAARVIRNFLPPRHRSFYEALPFVVAAARDAGGRPWATLIAGEPGFIQSPDDRHLSMAGGPNPDDALFDAFSAGAEIGLLGIELSTRRRNRVNGRIERVMENDAGYRFAVDQTFGNCPQHIQVREWEANDDTRSGEAAEPIHLERFQSFDPVLRARIESADTFFIASGYTEDSGAQDRPSSDGMDASHRGGPIGFVSFDEEGRLVFPDYAGNDHFNTLGNLIRDPRAGLVFVDFETGGLLQLTGTVEIDWDPADLGLPKEGGAGEGAPKAQRLVRFTLEEGIDLPRALPIRWRAV